MLCAGEWSAAFTFHLQKFINEMHAADIKFNAFIIKS
jgi:hypothetical protein